MDEPLSDGELAELERLTDAASVAPWVPFIEGPGVAGSSFIRLGAGVDDSLPDMYVLHEDKTAPVADIEFIAAARTYLPRLLAEILGARSRQS